MRISVSFRTAGDGYWPDNTLGVMPTPGFPLRAGTRYALVVTDALAATSGRLQVVRIGEVDEEELRAIDEHEPRRALDDSPGRVARVVGVGGVALAQ